jgi:Ca2+-binding EF-hand superfamily protein
MKTTLSTCLIALGLISGVAMAGDTLRGDTDGDGRLSRAEATAKASERTGEWFDKLDADKDGYVTQDEMSKAREDRRAGMREKMDEHFNEADANKDGQLSLDEVQAKMPRLADRFSAIDKDKNGLLSKEELARGGRHHHAPSS